MTFEGVFVAHVTAFTTDGALDLPAMNRHLDFLVEAGIDGLVTLGTTGEVSTLNQEERTSVLSAVCAHPKAKNLKLIAGCGGNSTASVVQAAKQAKQLGFHAGLAVTPYYNKPTPEGLVAHYEAVAAVGLPIILYNVPSRVVLNISASLLDRLLEIPNVMGIKEASGNHGQWLDYCAVVQKHGATWLSGNDTDFATIAAFGGQGIISAAGNVIPRPFVEMWKHIRDGNLAKAFAIQKSIHPANEALFTETNPCPTKYAMSLMGLVENKLRLPLVTVTEQTQQKVRTALETMGVLN